MAVQNQIVFGPKLRKLELIKGSGAALRASEELVQ